MFRLVLNLLLLGSILVPSVGRGFTQLEEGLCPHDLLTAGLMSDGSFIDVIMSVSVSPNGEYVAVARFSGVYIHGGETLERITPLYCAQSGIEVGLIEPVSWSPDGEKIATFDQENGIGIWNADDGSLIMFLRGENDIGVFNEHGELAGTTRVEDMRWSPDSRFIASVGNVSHLPLRVWDVQNREIIFEQELTGSSAHNPGLLGWSPDGSQLVFGEASRFLLWDTETWQPRDEIISQTPIQYAYNRIDSFSWSQANEFAFGGVYNTLQIIDMDTQTLTSFSENYPHIMASTVNWLPGTSILAIARDPDDKPGRDYTAQIDIIDTASGDVLQSLIGHTGTITGLHWYPDGERLLSFQLSYNYVSRVILWNVETGDILAELSTDND